jgi:hypothetical protein
VLADSLERSEKKRADFERTSNYWRSVAEVAGRMLRDAKVTPRTDDEVTVLEYARAIPGPRPTQRGKVRPAHFDGPACAGS